MRGSSLTAPQAHSYQLLPPPDMDPATDDEGQSLLAPPEHHHHLHSHHRNPQHPQRPRAANTITATTTSFALNSAPADTATVAPTSPPAVPSMQRAASSQRRRSIDRGEAGGGGGGGGGGGIRAGGIGAGGADDRALRGALQAARRWKSATARATHIRRLHDAIDQVLERHNPGSAPGIDPRRSKYHHLAAKWCLPARITVVDYDSRSLSIHSGLDGAEQLAAFLSQPRGAGAGVAGAGAGAGAGPGTGPGTGAGAGSGAREGHGSSSSSLSGPSFPSSCSRGVRWIHVDGMNWDVLQVLALKFDLHPLALEDTVHVPQRIKADFYDSCLYMALIYLYLARGDAGDVGEEAAPPPPPPTSAAASAASLARRILPRTISTVRKAEAAATSTSVTATSTSVTATSAVAGRSVTAVSAAAAAAAANGGGGGGGSSHDLEGDGGLFDIRRPTSPPLRNHRVPSRDPLPLPLPLPVPRASGSTIGGGGAAAAGAGTTGAGGARSRGGGGGGVDGDAPASSSSAPVPSIHVSAQQVSLFLLRGEHPNTLITVFQSDGSAVTEPILEQLREPRTLVREAEDASFLANLVIDTLVDHLFPMVGAYREALQSYEGDVAHVGSGPAAAASTRELHAMQRELRRLDRTVAPLQAVVANMVARDTTPLAGGGPSSSPSPPPPPPFLSPLTCTYLNDVRDHVATICEDLLSLSTECGDLIGLIFNLTTLAQAQSTQALAVVSTIFLPITFLAGVYGMNFDVLPELHWPLGYAYFWATSVLIVVVFVVAMRRAGLWS